MTLLAELASPSEKTAHRSTKVHQVDSLTATLISTFKELTKLKNFLVHCYIIPLNSQGVIGRTQNQQRVKILTRVSSSEYLSVVEERKRESCALALAFQIQTYWLLIPSVPQSANDFLLYQLCNLRNQTGLSACPGPAHCWFSFWFSLGGTLDLGRLSQDHLHPFGGPLLHPRGVWGGSSILPEIFKSRTM